VGIHKEGFRFVQVIFFAGFLITLFSYLLFKAFYWDEPYPLWLGAILFMSDFVASVITIVKGEADFSRFPINGPYQVGYREFRTTIHDNEVSVFYPIEREYYREHIKRRNTLQQRHGDNTIRGLARASVDYGREDHLPLIVFKFMKYIYLDTIENGDLALDFIKAHITVDGKKIQQKTLIPIIMSHGLSGNRNWNSGTCRDLASHGYIVFAIDHRDETSNYVETKDGKGMFYNNSKQSHDMEYRSMQLGIREREMIALIDEIFDSQTLLKKLNFPDSVKIDQYRLIGAGHSFGGMTAIATASLDSRIKALITLDPWLYVKHKEI